MLEIKNLSASIEGVQVLRGVHMTLAPASTTALIGRNGAGKTSLLRSIMGFMNVGVGDVAFEGASITAMKPHLRPRLGIGYAPEDRRLFGSFTLEENLRLPAEVMGIKQDQMRKRLEAVYEVLPELHDMRERRAAGLSGGQGKMVALGRALMIGTKVVLLDEPFQGLAPALANRYAAALRDLRNKNPDITLLITESNPSLLRDFAEQIYVIERGEINSLENLPKSSLEAAGMAH